MVGWKVQWLYGLWLRTDGVVTKRLCEAWSVLTLILEPSVSLYLDFEHLNSSCP